MPWRGCSSWGDTGPGRAALRVGKARGAFRRQGRGLRAWLRQRIPPAPAAPRKPLWKNLGWGRGVERAVSSTYRVKSRALRTNLISKHLPAQLSGNANTQHFSQTLGGIRSRCDCAANVIYAEPQIPSSAACFLSLEHKQPDLSFIPSTSLRWDSCLCSWLDASDKTRNFTLAVLMRRGCSCGGGQRSQGGG